MGWFISEVKSSVISQKGESQNGGNKTKHSKFSEKANISYPLACTRTLFVDYLNESKGSSQFLPSSKLHIYLELSTHF